MSLLDLPVYMDGSVPRIRIEREDGTAVLEEDVEVESLDRPLLRRRLEGGSYRLHSVQLPCEGNCGYLQAPDGTRCAVPFEVDGVDQVVEIVLRREPEGGPRAACTARRA